MTTTATKTEIQALASVKDWRYFEFYLGHVQTLGRESAGEMVRRINAADAAAQDTTAEQAQAMRDTYVDMILPQLPDTIEGQRALLQIRRALEFCPQAK